MIKFSVNLKRTATAAFAGALLLTGLGCGQPGAIAPGAMNTPGISRAMSETQENEPGWRGPKEDLGHFFKVNDTLYRGQQPSDKGFEMLKEKGIKTVVYLHFSKSQAAHEKKVVEGLGMNFVHIPMSWLTPPKESQIKQWLAVTGDTNQGPVFVHCQHGRDRTGTMVGIYRIAYEGWTFDQAYAEMKEMGFRTFFLGLTHGVKKFARAYEKDVPQTAAAY